VQSGAGVRSHEVEALARERLGAEIQAVSLLHSIGDGAAGLRGWSVLTEHGVFWLLEGPAGAEMFRAIMTAVGANVARAVRRYLELHPEAATPATAAASEPYACRACGAAVAPVRPSARIERGLCTRCYHAERARRRYREDPEYRARERARRRGPTRE
jgi:hypothetical protein